MSEDSGRKVEGYWASSDLVDEDIYQGRFPFPKPHAGEFHGKELFLKYLKKIETSDMVQKQFQNGYSKCRFGDFDTNGSSEYTFVRGDYIAVWPEGFRHYVEVHNVLPSREFYRLVVNIGKTLDKQP